MVAVTVPSPRRRPFDCRLSRNRQIRYSNGSGLLLARVIVAGEPTGGRVTQRPIDTAWRRDYRPVGWPAQQYCKGVLVTDTHGTSDNDIAVVGVAGSRLPGARNVREFWRNLQSGVESVEHFAPEVARARQLPPEETDAPGYQPVTATAADLDLFDAEFFGFSNVRPSSATRSSGCSWSFPTPPDRWRARPARRSGAGRRVRGQRPPTATGTTTSRQPRRSRAAGLTSMSTGNNPDYIAPLVSYKLGFQGPSLSV